MDLTRFDKASLAFDLFLLSTSLGFNYFVYRQTSVNVLHQQLQLRRKIDRRCRVVESHVAERNEIFTECEPTEGQVVAQQSMLEEENDQSNCACNWQCEEQLLVEQRALVLHAFRSVRMKDFEETQRHQHVHQWRDHKYNEDLLMQR